MTQRGIVWRLLLALLILVLAPVTLLDLVTQKAFHEIHARTMLHNLIRIADKKTDQIDAFVQEQLKDIRILSHNPLITDGYKRLNKAFMEGGPDSEAYRQADLQLRPLMAQFLEEGGFYDAFLVSKSLQVVFTIKKEADFGANLHHSSFRNSELAKVVISALSGLEPDFSQYTLYEPSQAPAAFIAAPIMDDDQLLGVVALQIDTGRFREVMLDYTGLGETGETVIVRRENDQVLFLLPLKSDPDAAFNRRLPLSSLVGQPILDAVLGRQGAALSEDYRGHEVLAVWRYLPSVRLGMVVKIDANEALEELSSLRDWQRSFLLGALLSLLLISLYMGRIILIPIQHLTKVTDQLAHGDLNQRVSIFGADEVKHLGDAFNSMASKLQDAHDTLESRIQERTAELKESNLLLTEQMTIREKVEQDLKENIALQRAILQSANVTIISTDILGMILSFNAAAEKKLGYSANEVIGKATLMIIHDKEEIVERAHALSKELGRTIQPGFEVFIAKAKDGQADENEWTFIRKDGSRFPVALSVTALFDDRGTLTGFMGIGQDLSEIKVTQERLRMAEKVFVNAGEAIIITDIDAKIIDVNPAYSAITGYRREEILGLNPKVLKSGRHPPEFYQNMWQTIRETGTWEGEIWDRRKNGEVYPKWLSISSIRDKDGRATHYVGIFMDISRQKSTEEQLERLAYYDPLTNLANRALFRERLTHELAQAQRNEGNLAIFFIDLDRFKYVNDTMGHAAGDELLKIVAQKLRSRVRASDTVARMGGDEFTVILTGAVRPESISRIAQEMLDDLRAPMEIQGVEVRIGGSIGIATYPQDGTDYTTLTKHADMAMYLAKENGRNNYQFFSQELQTRIFDRITLEDELHKAVINQEFLLHYQPQYDLASNRVVGVEALVRWKQQGKGMVSPATFIPLAEETGLILPMGEWILETALRQTTLWHGQGADHLRIAVNLSPKQFQQPTLLPLIGQLLEETKLPPSALELEITESTLMGNLEESIAIMKRLRELGIALALDDFGTGYSSLGYLKRFPVNTLKIDQSFVRELTCDSKDMVIVQAIIGLAHTMDLTVVAEGVETPFQLEFLREQGCDQVQGYLLSRPLASQDVTKVL